MAPKRGPPAAAQQASNKAKEAEVKKEEQEDSIEWLVTKLCLVLGLAAVASTVSQLNLSPVYGSIVAAEHHTKGVTFAALFGFMGRDILRKRLPPNILQWLPVLAFYAPMMTYSIFAYSATLGTHFGPIVTELLTFYPLLLGSAYCAADLLEKVDITEIFSTKWAERVFVYGLYLFFSSAEKAAGVFIPRAIGFNPLLTRSGLQLLVATGYALLAPSTLLALALPAVLHTLVYNPHVMTHHGTAMVNQTLHQANFSLLDRAESLTGYISVVESHGDGYRLLRCDHSLLGGEWHVTPERMSHGVTEKEPIYAVFAMLEAVRLVEVEPAPEQLEEEKNTQKQALVIGLGIGTAPAALTKHGVNTTVVEIDSVVYDFAEKYFDLPSNHTRIISDAAKWVETASVTSGISSYDYIIHDVFTGGAEPASLFTLEFLHGLRSLVKTGGVVAINYAGDLRMQSTKLIFNTIYEVFPICRIFRDTPKSEGEEEGNADFLNMVLFCIKEHATEASEMDSDDLIKEAENTPKITFRHPTEADYLNSVARRRYLYPAPELEMQWPPVLEEALRDEKGGRKVLKRGHERDVEGGHAESAANHWRIMRTVVPSFVWENW